MVRVLGQFVSSPRACSYLPTRTAQLQHRLIDGLSAGDLEHLLERGWRRFGLDYLRPQCLGCGECISTRIPLDDFRPSRSQRRAVQRTRHWQQRVGTPRTDRTRVELHQRWYQARQQLRGWDSSELSLEDYQQCFAHPHAAAREISWYDNDQLVAVSLCDETPRALSAVYFFYAPEVQACSPGVANVIRLCELGRTLGKRHLYLGYLVEQCLSLRYKGSFLPREELRSRPGDREPAEWRRVLSPLTS